MYLLYENMNNSFLKLFENSIASGDISQNFLIPDNCQKRNFQKCNYIYYKTFSNTVFIQNLHKYLVSKETITIYRNYPCVH